MPIKTFSLETAFANRKADIARWPSDPESQALRFSPIARPAFDAPFKISDSDFVFTVGSCFARNIEKQLAANGFDFAARHFELSHDESDFKGVDVSGVLNKYVVFSILNDLRFALDPAHPFTDEHYVELRGGKWWDPHLNNVITPADKARVLARREKVTNYFKTAAQADVFIITLGLAEAWFDTKTGLYANGTPPATIQRTEPERFEFHVLDYNQIVAALDDIHAVLQKFGKPGIKILVTVSPVALKSTFSGEDGMVANTYSKAVQRAAVSAFVAKHDNVAYFPSYESVTLSERSHAWLPDQLHASDEIVRYNVLAMMGAYTDRNVGQVGGKAHADVVADALTLMHKGEAAEKKGQIEEAADFYKQAVDMAPSEGLIAMNYARMLLRLKRPDEAVEAAKQAVDNGAATYGAHGTLATALRMAGRLDEAYAEIDKALAIAPTKRGNLHAKAVIAGRMKRYDEALGIYEGLLGKAGPDDDVTWNQFVRPYESTALAAGQSARAERFLNSRGAA